MPGWRTRPASKALHERALKSLPNGVTSNFQVGDPYPVYLEKGKGSSVWDVDGTEYKDFHGGFGVNIVGHAHPKIVEALEKAAREAIHFAVTTPTTVALAEAICERFELEQVRIVNSGTEATMDALRVARAATGRDKVFKMEGSYHGHHDSLLFSVVPEADVLGLRHDVEHEGKAWYTTQPTSKGIPKALWDTTIVVPFNDAAAVEEALADNEGEVAAVILEPVMMNVGIIEPQPGYLQALRDACEKHGTVLIYDEVKCGGTIAYGGTMERYGVKPHLVRVRQGDRRRLDDRRVRRRGGGSWSSSTRERRSRARSTGTRCHRPPASPRSRRCWSRTHTTTSASWARSSRRAAIGRSPTRASRRTRWTSARRAASRTEPNGSRTTRDFLETHPELYWASYPWMVNRGIFMTPGDEEQWTISVQHTEDDVQRYIDAFGEFCQELSAS